MTQRLADISEGVHNHLVQESRPLDLADLRPQLAFEVDLRWYLNESEAEMSHRSNFGAMVGRIEAGGRSGSSVNHGMDPRAISAAARARPIADALRSLTEEHHRILVEAYREQALIDSFDREAPKRLAPYGSLAGLVPFTPTAVAEQAKSQRSMVEWLVRVQLNASKYVKQGRLYTMITSEAEGRLLAAARAYGLARKSQHRPRRGL